MGYIVPIAHTEYCSDVCSCIFRVLDEYNKKILIGNMQLTIVHRFFVPIAHTQYCNDEGGRIFDVLVTTHPVL